MSKGYPGWEGYTLKAGQGVPRSKYRAERTECGGIVFASRREAARYQTLLAEQQAGRISGLEVQPQYPLSVVQPNGVTVVIGRYIADFRYQRDGRTVIEDSKGIATDFYKWKRRHAEAQYGIEIVEV